MHILLNGETQEMQVGATLAFLIARQELAGKRLAVEVNEEIVPRSEYAAHQLQEGDRVEIVQAIGGG